MKFRLALALSLVAGTTLPALAATDNNTFVLLNKGKAIGKAAYTIAKTKEGFRVNTRYQYRVKPTDLAPDAGLAGDMGKASSNTSLDAQFSAEYRLSPEGDLLGGFVTDATTQMITGFTPSKARDNITVGVSQAGNSGQPTVIPMPQTTFTFMPNFDPAAIQILLTTAIAHPHADAKYLTIIPASNPRSGPTTAWLSFQPTAATAASGTLDSKPVTLKHYTFKFYAGTAEVYADDTGNLMEADITATNSSYVRTKFALAPAAK